MNNKFMSRIQRNRQTQTAFSLIELLIAMAIGLFLLLGLGIVFVSMSQTSSVQSQLAQLQDNERMAMTLLTDIIQEAGYFDNTGTNQMTTTATQAMPPSGSFNAAQAVFGTHNASAPGDSISVRFSTTNGDNIVNCQGASNTGATQVTINTFYVDGNNNLACSINGGAGQALVNGVTNLQILYGVDNQQSGSVDTYLGANAMSNAGWAAVRSIVIQVTFTNPLYKAGQTAQPPTITLTRTIQVTKQAS